MIEFQIRMEKEIHDLNEKDKDKMLVKFFGDKN